MRLAVYALITALWFASSPILARNGETGILISVHQFEFLDDAQHPQTTLVLCKDDLQRITASLEEGHETSIYLPGYGIFEVQATPEGAVKLYQNNIEIEPKDCPVAAPGLCS